MSTLKIVTVTRVLVYGLLLAAMSILFYQDQRAIVEWIVLYALMAWPVLAYYLSVKIKRFRHVIHRLKAVDAFLCGGLVAATHFSIIPTMVILTILYISMVSAGGLEYFMKGTLLAFIGAITIGFIYGPHFLPVHTFFVEIAFVMALLIFVILFSLGVFSHLSYLRNIRKQSAKIHEEIKHVNDLAQKASRSLDLEEVIDPIGKFFNDTFGFDLVIIRFINEEHDGLYVHGVYGIDLDDSHIRLIKEAKVNLDEPNGIAATVYLEEELVYHEKITAEQDMLPVDRKIYQINPYQSLLVLPLKTAHGTIGSFTLINHHDNRKFTYDDLMYIQKYVGQLSICIKNAFLYARTKEDQKKLQEKTAQLQNVSETLSKYLSPQIYQAIVLGKKRVKLETSRKHLSVLFSEVEGFSYLTDKLGTQDLIDVLNRYLSKMTDLTLEFGGTLDKYVGDSMLIFFGDPETKGPRKDALDCVNLAIAMKAAMTEVREIWREYGIDEKLSLNIGINSGYCTVGNFGSKYKMDYTIIGTQANIASRIEKEASGGKILVSADTFVLVKEEIDCKLIGEVSMRGLVHPIDVYQVVDGESSHSYSSDFIKKNTQNSQEKKSLFSFINNFLKRWRHDKK